MVVLVQGPPGVGKTTVIQALIRHYTRHSIPHPKGPITLVAGKQRRLTLVECPQVCWQQCCPPSGCVWLSHGLKR